MNSEPRQGQEGVIVGSGADDIVYSQPLTGVLGNDLKSSIEKVGMHPTTRRKAISGGVE